LTDKTVMVGASGDRATARSRTTLATIAADAGVSLPTVSKVVNGRPDVAGMLGTGLIIRESTAAAEDAR
jgi:LacI family transcriptional regulator